MAQILIAEDNDAVAEAAAIVLESEGWTTHRVAQADRIVAASEGCDLVLLDLNYEYDTTSGREGLELIRALRSSGSGAAVVAMTAWSTVELAVAALKNGAVDFVEKPWDNERLKSVVRTQLALAASNRERECLQEHNRLLNADSTEFVAGAPAMRELLRMAERVAHTDASVLILGENGTGKSLLAHEIHRASARAREPFVSVNMGAIPEGLFESEMFGHRKGAFTDARDHRVGRFELAGSGTLFLDEIANIPVSQQPKLLRVLETGEFERVGESRSRRFAGRVISATNSNLDARMTSGDFRRDLLFRLNTVTLEIPPLRDRPADLQALTRLILERMATRYGRRRELARDALSALRAYAWPGNVRELSHVLERAVILCEGDSIGAKDLNLELQSSGATCIGRLEDIERQAIEAALARFDGNVTEAAEALGISRSACYRRMEKLGL